MPELKDILNARFAAAAAAQDRADTRNLAGYDIEGGAPATNYISGFTDAMLNKDEHGEDLNKKRRRIQRDLGELRNEDAVLKDIQNWIDGPDWPILQVARESRLHKILEGGDPKSDLLKRLSTDTQIFLMQHDWASMISGTEAESGEFHLPADLCAFEFQISGRRYITLWGEDITQLIETPYGWYISDVSKGALANNYSSLSQIRAMCIFLEAGAIESETVRAPYRLNQRRERRGKLPILDHHTLKLSSRRRYVPLEEENRGTHRSPRMHFRRGHWRHFDNHKTWIRWQIVGNPDLGFIDKTYLA